MPSFRLDRGTPLTLPLPNLLGTNIRLPSKVAISIGAGTGIGEAIAHKYIFGVNCPILPVS
jgi:hypothetical protein